LTVSHAFGFDESALSLRVSGGWTSVSCPGAGRAPSEAGFPALPAFSAVLLVPAGAGEVASVSCSADCGDDFVLPAPLAPLPGVVAPGFPETAGDAAVDEASYAASEFSSHVLSVGPVRRRGGRPFVAISVTPLSWRASDLAARFATNLVVTVSFTDAGGGVPLLPAAAGDGAARDLARLAANPSALAEQEEDATASVLAEGETVDYLIVTTNALTNAFAAYAEYRASKAGGRYAVEVVTTDEIASEWGDGAEDLQAAIRACISNYVSAHATRFVLLGGDDSAVPDRDTYGAVNNGAVVAKDIPCDLYYADCLSGSWDADGDGVYGETADSPNMVADVYLGRLPVRTEAQVTNYLGKVVRFEAMEDFPPQRAFFFGTESWDSYTGTNRPNDDVTGDGHLAFRDDAHATVSDSEMWLRRLWRDGVSEAWETKEADPGYLFDTLTSWDGSDDAGTHALSFANIKSDLGEGFMHMFFCGHGMPTGYELEDGNWWLSGTGSLTNVVPFYYTDACLSGAFDGTNVTIDADTTNAYTYTKTEPCFAEAQLRNGSGGFLSFIGASRYGWGTEDDAPASDTSTGGPSLAYAYKFFSRFYETTNAEATLGEIFNLHKADMLANCGKDGAERWIMFALNLLGDPAIPIRPAELPEGAPDLSCTATNATALDFAWTASTNASATYRFQLGTIPTVVETGSSLSESFEDGTTPEGWENDGVDILARSTACSGSWLAKYDASGDFLISPALTNPATVAFSVRKGNAFSGCTFAVEAMDETGETLLATAGTVTPSQTSWTNVAFDLTACTGEVVRIRFRQTTSGRAYLDAVEVTGAEGDALIDETVSETAFSATGLAEETTYYARVSIGSTGKWSDIVSATTAASGPAVSETVLTLSSLSQDSTLFEGADGTISLAATNWPDAFAVQRTTNLLSDLGGWETLAEDAYLFTNGVLSFPLEAAFSAYRLVEP